MSTRCFTKMFANLRTNLQSRPAFPRTTANPTSGAKLFLSDSSNPAEEYEQWLEGSSINVIGHCDDAVLHSAELDAGDGVQYSDFVSPAHDALTLLPLASHT